MKQFYSLCMIMLLASVLAIDVMGQKTTLTVTGKVTDLEGDPLSGVSVVVQGTTRGTITNIDGAYSINVPSKQSVLVFSRTKHNADRIVRVLSKAGIGSQAIHGNKSQNARQSALENFKTGKIRVMIATDIAARGIDINELPLVINYDLPDVPETYVHRIGRTGRAGNLGTALTFCSQEERKLVNDIQKLTGKKLSKVEFAI